MSTTAWPGEDIVYTHRPKNRPRHGSEALVNNRTVIVDASKLNPEMFNNNAGQQRRRRSSSASSQQQPTQIIINNDNGANARNQQYHDEHDEHVEHRRASPPQQRHRRPSSVYVDERGYSMMRVRSSSRARRTPPIDMDDEYEYRYLDEYDDRRVGRQVVHVGGARRSSTPSWERRRREHEEAERRRRAEEDRFKAEEERFKAEEARIRKDAEDRLKAEEERIKRHAEDEAKLKELADIKRQQAEEEERKRIEKEIHLKKLEAERAQAERDEEDKKIKAAAIEEYKIKMAEEEAKHRREQEEQEDKMVALLMAGNAGMSERDARKFIRRAEKAKERGGRAASEDGDEGPSNGLVPVKPNKLRPTYIKVHSKHLSPETLDVYSLPWEWESSESDFIIIKQWISEPQQEMLFNHTRQLRERARLSYPRDRLRNDASQLVIPKEDKKRKKSPIKRTSWFLT